MNRSGHTPTLLIIPIAFLLIITAVTSFVFANKPVDAFSKEISQDLRSQLQYEHYIRQVFEDSVHATFSGSSTSWSESFLTSRFQHEVSLRDFGIVEAGNFFLVVKRGEITISRDSDVWNLEVKGIFISKQSEILDTTRWFNATARILPDGSAQYIYK
jgi:hypothetical protein